MRLTLRTLLAYLDDALDPQETELLRTKVAESGFATQLVQRIRLMLANGSVPAPSPEAMGPVEEANVISEYLDSTLPGEQVAEIERACLESDPHLAEAAACHQILTMVLREPAYVPPELRLRIYELPDRTIEEIASGESFSSVNIPVEPTHVDPITSAHPNGELDPILDGLPTADLTGTDGAIPVLPVGVADSGVSDAPTRIRQADNDAELQGQQAIAGVPGSSSRPSELEATYYGRSIRPSRIAPWLVSLGLAAVLLFVLAQIFQPLLDPQDGSGTKTVAQADGSESVEPAESTGEADAVTDENSVAASAEDDVATDETATLPENADAVADAADVATDNDDAEVMEEAPDDSATNSVADATEAAQDDELMEAPPETISIDAPLLADLAPADAADAADSADPDSDSPPVPPPPADVAQDTGKPQPPPPAPAPQQGVEIAKVTSENSLVAAWDGAQWQRIKREMMISSGMDVVCAPTFRAQMSVQGLELTVVGPAHMRWLGGGQNAVLNIESGRVLVSATEPDAVLYCQLGDEAVDLNFSDVDSVAAVSVKHFRAAGFDPLKPENRIPLTGILSVQGTFKVGIAGTQQTLKTGEQWIKRGADDAEVTPVETVPEWINPPDPNSTDLEAVARDGLLELLKRDQPLEIALREATLFRRTEVAALASEALLSLGHGDVYFGGEGVLSQSSQRLFWPDHVRLLVATVDRSAESAQQLRDAIESMDSANAKPLFRLLTGYSQNQLVEGGDEELVQMLASASMAVRVLALENLRMITGSTANFRPERENPAITKWLTRQRRGDIRWQE